MGKNPYGTWMYVKRQVKAGARITIHCRDRKELYAYRLSWTQQGYKVKIDSKTLTMKAERSERMAREHGEQRKQQASVAKVILNKGVYCNPGYEDQVNSLLRRVYEVVSQRNPEWGFDVDGPDWERYYIDEEGEVI